MLDAKAARKLREEAARKVVEEKLSKKIEEACREQEFSITLQLTQLEKQILEKAGYKVIYMAQDTYEVAWD